MALTASYVEIAEALVAKLEANSTALGLKGVFYGDQNKLPATPIVCVEPDIKDNVAMTPTRNLTVEVLIFLIVYHSAVDSPQANRQASDTLAEAIEDLIHEDPFLLRNDATPRVVQCYIKSIASGYVKKGTGIVRASRLTFHALTKHQLPNG